MTPISIDEISTNPIKEILKHCKGRFKEGEDR